MLRMSNLFLRTLREDPADAEVASHRLMVRAGMVRRAAPGGFTWLPLGWIVFRNVERIVREEMDAAGCQEVHFPALLPKEPYEATGRWTEYGPNLFRLVDRRGQVRALRRLPACTASCIPLDCSQTWLSCWRMRTMALQWSGTQTITLCCGCSHQRKPIRRCPSWSSQLLKKSGP